jgi:CO/xanthine dehydrogenase Mo-binding subunit
VARELADRAGRPVRVLWSREDAVRLGPKRPPLAAGVDPRAGRVAVRVARCAGVVEALLAGLGPGLDVAVEEVDVLGPPTSLSLRAAGWAEGVVLGAAARGELEEVVAPSGGRARATVRADGGLEVWAWAGELLDDVVLRSFCIGAAHAALSWVTSEGIGVGEDGVPVDLTVRSLGVVRAVDTPPIEVHLEPSPAGAEPVACSDAVFAAVAAAVWAHQGYPPSWPTGVRLG